LFDNPFVLNLCMWECCPLVNHDNGVVAQWNVFFGCNVDRMIDILNLRFMNEDDHYQLNSYMLYVGTYQQVLHMWGGKCLHELLVPFCSFNFVITWCWNDGTKFLKMGLPMSVWKIEFQVHKKITHSIKPIFLWGLRIWWC